MSCSWYGKFVSYFIPLLLAAEGIPLRPWVHTSCVTAALTVIAAVLPSCGAAQQLDLKAAFPDSPGALLLVAHQTPSTPATEAQGTASISGLITDVNGGVVPGATIAILARITPYSVRPPPAPKASSASKPFPPACSNFASRPRGCRRLSRLRSSWRPARISSFPHSTAHC